MATPAPDLTVTVPKAAWRRGVPALARFAKEFAQAAHDAAVKDGAAALTGETVIAFAGNDAVQDLNATFRGQNKPTNVLSFPSPGHHGGDVILALETVRDEAAAQGKTLADHTAHLIVHGILHLMGYDHLVRGDARRMERLERRVLGTFGIADPYA
ncbi:Endoribonuclease YbeY [Alphaproteobacteria bacterium SO-S41]|nr:Endoribonuclease YbeY [Alphaproteobacteria bacterium SO-S41]